MWSVPSAVVACCTVVAGLLGTPAGATAPLPDLLVTTRVASAVTAVHVLAGKSEQVAWAAPSGQEAGPAGGVHLTAPSWVPRTGAFVVGWNHDVAGVVDRSEVRRVDLRTGRVTTLVALTGRGEVTEVAVSPDGRQIAFGLRTDDDPAGALDPGRLGSTQQLWLLPLGGGTPEPVAANAQEHATDLAWSRDGRSLAWVDRAGLYIARAPGSGEVLAPVGPADLLVRRPVWLPGARAVLLEGVPLAESAGRRTPSVWLVPLAGGSPRPLLPGQEPAVSPDGSRVVVRTPTGLVVLRLADGRRTVLTRGPHDAAAAWSADARWVAYSRVDGERLFRSGVRVVRPDGRGDHAVTGWQDAGVPWWRPGA